MPSRPTITLPSLSTLPTPKPVFALAGAGDVAVERLRARIAAFPTQAGRTA